MPATALSAATLGIDAYPVHVEVDTDRQLPSFTVVGLPDNAVKESEERVMAAIRNAGYEWPRRRGAQPDDVGNDRPGIHHLIR